MSDCKMPQTSGPRSSPGPGYSSLLCEQHQSVITTKSRGGATGGGAAVCLHHCPSTGQGCRRTPGDHCHTGARCATLQTTNRQEGRDTASVNNDMFTGHKQTRQEAQHRSLFRRQRRLTDLLVSHRSPQVGILI